jgi:nucleoside-diphosphate-sugar epimerase
MDWIFHLAGVTKARDRQGYVDGNVTITTRLLQACRSQPGLKKFVYVSSQAAAGPSLAGIPLTEADAPHPISIYGECKLAAEKEVLSISGELPVVVPGPRPGFTAPETATFWFTFRMSTGIGAGFWAKAISESVGACFRYGGDGIVLAPKQPASTAKVFLSLRRRLL